MDDEELVEGDRSKFDVVVFDRHSTERLALGNYLFWGGVPKIDGVSIGRTIADEVIFDWDDTHRVLRHVSVETLVVDRWNELILPPEAESLIDGQTSSVLAYLTRQGSQFLVSAFSPIVEDEQGDLFMNTYWVTSPDFVVFMQNAVQFLASSVAITGRRSVKPGEPVTLPVGEGVEKVRITRPDGVVHESYTAGLQFLHYAQTRQVGLYRTDTAIPGHDMFAVNLFDPVESRVQPSATLTIGATEVKAKAGEIEANEPAWPYFLLAMLLLLILEWIVYNQRVFV